MFARVDFVIILAVLLSCLAVAKGQDAIRLVNGPYGPHMGRLEVQHNGTWGTVCSLNFFKVSADVACKSLGYSRGAVCLVPWGKFGSGSGPIWMSRVSCNGSETALSDCSFPGWGVVRDCTHADDVGVICYDERLVQVPTIQILQSTTKAISIQIMTPDLPNGTIEVSYRLSYYANGTSPNSIITEHVPKPWGPFNYTLVGLSKGTAYSLQAQTLIEYAYCPLSFLASANSGIFNALTQNKLPPSNFQIRLAPVGDSRLANLGRLEVFHNDQWGSVCGDSFTFAEADVVCNMLNFSQGSHCSVKNAAFGAGIGPVWLGGVRCSNTDELLDQCRHSEWGASGCNHSNDVGVVCRPDDLALNLTVANVTSTSISLKWTPYPSSPYVTSVLYWIQYIQSPSQVPITVSTSQAFYTLRGLSYGTIISASIRADIQYSLCFTQYEGGYQSSVVVTTKEDAPYSPPANLKVLALNSTSVQVRWSPPNTTNLSGRLRGYRLFYGPEGQQATMVALDKSTTLTYTASGLAPATAYVFTILAYTLADGPRAAPVIAVTKETDYFPYIVTFGVNGDDIDNTTMSAQDAGIRVLCGAGLWNVTPLWYTADGAVVITGNRRRVSQSHFQNGTAILELVPDGFLTLCDAGLYTCRVEGAGGTKDERTFSLTIGVAPPPPMRPEPVRAQSTFIVVQWAPPTCNGGHRTTGYILRYKEVANNSSDYQHIFNIRPTRTNYTIDGLKPSSTYLVSVQSIDSEFVTSPFSSEAVMVTLPPAPSPPLNFSAKLSLPNMVELRWAPPAVSNGNILHYTAYGIPLTLYEAAKSTIAPSHLAAPIRKVFEASATAGTVTITTFNVVYQFQITASVYIQTIENEGQPSAITNSSTIFIPEPELPTVQALQLVGKSNTTVSLIWSPPKSSVPVLYYNVNISGQVVHSSSSEVVEFQDIRQFSTVSPMVSIAPLVPNTTYTFSVYAVYGTGTFVGVSNASSYTTVTALSVGDSLAYIQVRLSPVSDCVQWASENTTSKLKEITLSLLHALNQLCDCGLTSANFLDKQELSCRSSTQGVVIGGASGTVVYRASLIGTDTLSASSLVLLLQRWVKGGEAALAINGLLLSIDPNCSSALGGPNDPDCAVGPIGPVGVAATASPPVALSTVVVASMGAVIALQLVVLLAIILVFTYRRWRRKPISAIQLDMRQLAVTESGQSLLKNGRRSTESPDDGANMGVLENHRNFENIPHLSLNDAPHRGMESGRYCNETRSITPSDDNRTDTHFEDSSKGNTAYKNSAHLKGASSLCHLEDIRGTPLNHVRTMGTRDSGVDVGSNVDIKAAGAL